MKLILTLVLYFFSLQISFGLFTESNWVELSVRHNTPNGDVLKVFPYSDDIYIGGEFYTIGGWQDTVNFLAKYDFQDSTWNPFFDSTAIKGIHGYVHDIASKDDKLYVCGGFDSAGSSAVNNISFLDTTNLIWNSIGLGSNGPINTMKFHDSLIYIGGNFDSVDNISANNIAYWDGTNWNSIGTGTDGDVYSLKHYEDNLYVGGIFENFDTIKVDGLAKFSNAEISTVLDDFKGHVNCIDIYDNKLIIGGAFKYIIDSLENANNLLGIDSVNEIYSFDGGTDGSIYSMYPNGNKLFISGMFFRTGEVSNSKVALWEIPNSIKNSNPNKIINDEITNIKTYPNPASSIVSIEFLLLNDAFVSLEIYDLIGNKVTTIIKEKELGIGSFNYSWIVKNIQNGIYFYSLECNNKIFNGKIQVVK
ncbi:MAG: T9SS type A sorting domain-containing protein [Ignavibacteria bacterium]|nr:T9SS type A sorting domain-containing protein [Ignavibacteria bacterium]